VCVREGGGEEGERGGVVYQRVRGRLQGGGRSEAARGGMLLMAEPVCAMQRAEHCMF
jgi:hypothetical protein